MKAIRSFSVLHTLALAVLMAGLFPGRVHAQNAAIGKFNVPFEARWGKTVLPAGDYSLTMPSSALWGYVIVHKEPTGESVAMIRADTWEMADTSAPSKLIFERRGEAFFVRSLYLRDKGYVFSFAVHKAKGKTASRKPREVQATPAAATSR
jgi:hypothetical protein